MTDMNFRRILPEIRCQSCLFACSEPTPRGGFSPLLGWAFGPRNFMKNCHGDFIATHERPWDSQDWHGFPAHFAGNSLPVLSVPGFGAHSPRWFFDSVGMGVPPAKLHEKRRKPQEIPRCAGWFFDSVGMGLRPAKLHEKHRKPQEIPRCAGWFFAPVGMGVPPAKLHEKRQKPQEIPRCAGWFFAPVGMGVPPAKLHEKRQKPQEIPRCAGWFFDSVGMGVPPAKLHEKRRKPQE